MKGKRKAPSPPKSRTNPRTLSPKTSLGRKKRPAPLPPLLNLHIEEEAAAASSTSLLEDKDIKALIEGNFKKDFSSTPTLNAADMERKPAYVSPYLKIRENRKLTDEQKRILIEQVSHSNSRKNGEDAPSAAAPTKKIDQIFTIQEGQLVYQGNESPKLPQQNEEKLVAPPSPISPRPWFKRNPNAVVNGQPKDSAHSQSIFKTLEKKIHKNDEKEKDLPEYGYSRNSFFGNRFNIFAKLTSDETSSKKKEKEQEKRKSQIGMPNISELDREAAEIIQIGQELKKDVSEVLLMRAQGNSVQVQKEESVEKNESKTTKDLIEKFESDSSKVNPRVTSVSNANSLARKEFFGETKKEKLTPLTIEEINIKSEAPVETSKKDSPPALQKKDNIKSSPMLDPRKSKLPQLMNGIRKQDDLMGLWYCTYCTLQNPNW